MHTYLCAHINTYIYTFIHVYIPTQASLTMVWVSLGEVSSIVDVVASSFSPTVGLLVHIVWVIFTNVLMLNLLISMMAETFSNDASDTHSAVCMCVYVCFFSCVCVFVCVCESAY